WGTRGRVRRAIQQRGTQLVHWYAQDNRAAWTPQYYDKVARDCATYYGESYGHSGKPDQLVTLATASFPTADQPGNAFEVVSLEAATQPKQASAGDVIPRLYPHSDSRNATAGKSLGRQSQVTEEEHD
ncbi:MAG: hypothetical protein OES79_06950, partial [Planctomycetota bacterium]|nr:hypothetical protein [Planctomycetota bacterium]